MESSQKDVSERIRFLISLKNMTIQEFSDFISFPKGTLEKYLNSPRLPNAEFLSAIHSRMRVSAHWLLDGIPPMYLTDRREFDDKGVLLFDHSRSGVDAPMATAKSQFVPVPRFSVEASAGGGSLVQTEEGSGSYAYNKAFLDRRGLRPGNLAIISVRGESMAPDLHDGDLILLDRAPVAPEAIDSNAIYVVRYDDGLFVKRIQRAPGRRLVLASSNPAYPPITVSEADLDGVQIVGRVVNSTREW